MFHNFDTWSAVMADFAAADRDVDVLLLVDDEADVVEGSRPADRS